MAYSLKFQLTSSEIAKVIFGEHDRNIKLIEKIFDVEVFPRGSSLTLKGETQACKNVKKTLLELEKIMKSGYSLSQRDIDMLLRAAEKNSDQSLKDLFSTPVGSTKSNHLITPKTPNQKKYIEAINMSDVVFAWGPAGTGKTYLAMAMAVMALQRKEVKRIILTRPAVEAGEKLGFLPGDLTEKVNPYLRPLLDALHDMMDIEKAHSLVERGVIEIAPLAFMRGRTLNNAFVILDEAQNTTPSQMKMFLTRLGFDSKAVVTGDVTQIDLPKGNSSGLVEALDVLRNISEISSIRLKSEDVVRNPLIQKIVEAYEQYT